MTDRELLERAAKLMGCRIKRERTTAARVGYVLVDKRGEITHTFWNPLDDDADAFRLACTVGMGLSLSRERAVATVGDAYIVEIDGADTGRAARRAIVRAAAA